MKTQLPQKHHIETKFGRVRAYEKMKARSKWKNPGVPEFERNWFLRFHCGGESWDEMAGPAHPVADGIKALKVYVETVMEVRLQAAREGKLERLREVVAPARVVWLSEVIALHEKHAPKSEHSRKSRQRLAAIWREVLGLEPEEVRVCPKVWAKDNLNAWVRLRQEMARRNDAEVTWSTLRAEYKAGSLPAKDKVTEMPCNTTIVGYLRSAKSVFAAAGEYLPGLVLPDLSVFQSFEAGVKGSKGHGDLPEEVLQKVIEGLPAFKEVHLDAWTFFQVVAWTASRPVSLVRMTRADIAWQDDGTALLSVPVTKGGKANVARVPVAVAEALNALADERGLFGCSQGAMHRLHFRVLNPWLREMGVEGSQAIYRFRGHQIQATRDALGLEAATDRGAHSNSKTTATFYAPRRQVVPMVDWQTGAVQG